MPQKNIAFMSESNVSLAGGGFTMPSGAEVFLFHEVALVYSTEYVLPTEGPRTHA